MLRYSMLAAALVLIASASSQAATVQAPLRALDPNLKFIVVGTGPYFGLFLAPNVQFIDQNGQPMSPTLLKYGMPLTITYTPGDPNVATVVQGYRYIPPTPPPPPPGPFPR